MKKINYFLIIFATICLTHSVMAQDATAKLDEAQTAYTSHNLDNTRSALQEALTEINNVIGKDILNILPTKISDISYNEKEDNVNSSVGLNVNRTFGTSDGKNAKIEIMGDSPLIASLNALLSLPLIMASSDPNTKRITVNGYKGQLKKDTDENKKVSYTAQVPLNKTLLTFNSTGINAENEIIAILNSLPLDKIAKAAQ